MPILPIFSMLSDYIVKTMTITMKTAALYLDRTVLNAEIKEVKRVNQEFTDFESNYQVTSKILMAKYSSEAKRKINSSVMYGLDFNLTMGGFLCLLYLVWI